MIVNDSHGLMIVYEPFMMVNDSKEQLVHIVGWCMRPALRSAQKQQPDASLEGLNGSREKLLVYWLGFLKKYCEFTTEPAILYHQRNYQDWFTICGKRSWWSQTCLISIST